MIVFSHPTGNANVRNAALGLHEAGGLARFETTLSIPAEGAWRQFVPAKIRTELERRVFGELPRHLICSHPWREACRLALGRSPLRGWTHGEGSRLSIDAVYEGLDGTVARRLGRGRDETGVFCYEDGAIKTFGRAIELGLRRIYELPIGYWKVGRQLQEEEAELQPDWAATLSATTDSPRKCARKDAELSLASTVVVASSFTARTLASSPVTAPIHVVPYGFPPISPEEPPAAAHGRALRVLFVGGLSQRKGLSYLFEAVRRVRPLVELTVVGQPGVSCRALETNLQEHRWHRSLHHRDVLATMRSHDVLIFPSLFEGFGLVISEAMAQGMAVITTANTAGGDIIEHRKNGWIVPVRSADAIAAALEMFSLDRDLLQSIRTSARQSAASRCWGEYRRELVHCLSIPCQTTAGLKS